MWVTSSKSQMNGGCVAVWQASSHCGNNDCVEWLKSGKSFANGDCVQRTVRCKSSHTNPDACVELCVCGTADCGMVHVRDSKDPEGVRVDYAEATWDDGRAVVFLPVSAAVARASDNGKRALQVAADRGHDPQAHWYMVCPTGRLGAALWFDQAEVDAWQAGLRDGEFKLLPA